VKSALIMMCTATPLLAQLLRDQLENRRKQLREKLHIGRIVGLANVDAVLIFLRLLERLRLLCQ
jgi:hypothetical protein